MVEPNQVKVDNWGVFFLQRLKHFFNRTDYCDLTLQFQDNAQLKVHRLVLNACTEYFDLLERTCEMYEDCLIMPDDLQADVVVPIVNFMYTGQLEYKFDLLDKLYQTALIMNMTVLTKLLDAQRQQVPPMRPRQAPNKYKKSASYSRNPKPPAPTLYNTVTQKAPKITQTFESPTSSYQQVKKKPPQRIIDPKPTRYELPEELDTDNLFENSFSDISYDSKPLMVHPDREIKEEYSEQASSSKFEQLRKMMKRPSTSTADVEFKKIKSSRSEFIFDDREEYTPDESHMEDVFDMESTASHSKNSQHSSKLFDHVIETQGAKVTIETKSNTESHVDHAKIISEVLKKYPHLVKSNKNIKLKIVGTQSKQADSKTLPKKATVAVTKSLAQPRISKVTKVKTEPDTDKEYTYETAITDTKEVARLIALGVENVSGPWLCLICGTPGKALNFLSYHKFRNHLVHVHNERPPSNMCEYCGLKSGKRNHLLHHIYTKHGVPPPPNYHFPQCNQCSYIALTQAFLIKHKMTHSDDREFTCNVCLTGFKTSHQLLNHIQQTGHKISPERKSNMQCVYCMKAFLRESNLYTHLKTTHKRLAKHDGIIDFSDDDENEEEVEKTIKYEPGTNMEEDSEEGEYQISERGGQLQILNKTAHKPQTPVTQVQKVLNLGLSPKPPPSKQLKKQDLSKYIKYMPNNEEKLLTPVILNRSEYFSKGNNSSHETAGDNSQQEYIISDMLEHDSQDESQTINITLPQSQVAPMIAEPRGPVTQIQEKSATIIKKTGPVNQPIQIVVSNEQEYKALMASNPSILFEDGTQKSLSMLAHSSNVNTQNIPLENAQNNMMIIQENYPMNVSQAITSDSQIVVVYSHSMDTQNKQYLVNTQYTDQQMINTQGVQEQMMQATQVITQNYETMTDTVSLNEQVLAQENITSWQDEHEEPAGTSLIQVPNDQAQQTLDVEHQIIQIEEQVGGVPTVVDDKLNDLAEIQILNQQNVEEPLQELEEASQELQVSSQELKVPSQEIDMPSKQLEMPSQQMEVPSQELEVPSQELDVPSQAMEVHSHEIIQTSEEHLEEANTAEIGNDNDMQYETTEHTISEEVVPPEIDENEVPGEYIEIEQHVDETGQEIAEILQTDSQESASSRDGQTVIVKNKEDIVTSIVSTAKMANIEETEAIIENAIQTEDLEPVQTEVLGPVHEEIQNLTSEWSDDESTKPTEECLSQELPADSQEIQIIETPIEESEAASTNSEEESIENIQQEVVNQLNKIPPSKRVIVTSDIIITKGMEVIEDTDTPVIEDPKILKANEKISSLLNDWDDNDSQQESNGGKSPEGEAAVEETLEEEVDAENNDNRAVVSDPVKEAQKDEKIKSLVSDWDEEDEEKEV